MQFRVHEAAALELAEAAAHYAEEYEGRAMRFLLAYRDVINVALAFPSAATSIAEGERYSLRAFPLHRFPYTVFAAVAETELVVLAVAHQKRRPRYWVERLDDIAR